MGIVTTALLGFRAVADAVELNVGEVVGMVGRVTVTGSPEWCSVDIRIVLIRTVGTSSSVQPARSLRRRLGRVHPIP